MSEKLYQDKEWLHEMYWVQGKSTVEIARIAGCNSATILNWMKKFGIPRRTCTDGVRLCAQDPEWIERMTKAARRRAQNPEWRRKLIEAGHRLSQDPKWLRKTIEAAHRRSQDPKWRRKKAAANHRLALKRRNQGEMTNIEAICYAAFESLGLEFVFEKFIRRYRVDFFFPSHGIIVEAIGIFWHNRPGRREKDAERKQFLEACGYIVLGWEDHDIETDVWQLIDDQLLPLLGQPSRMERPPRGISKPYKGEHGRESATQLYLFGKEQGLDLDD